MTRPTRKREERAFTLIEILVATAVLALLLVLTLQILSNTNAAIRTADSQMDAATQARTALDRFESDFTNALLSHGSTALFLAAENNRQAAIGFLSRSRAREADSGTPSWRTDLRGTVIAYRMDDSLMARGTGRMTFNEEALGDHASGNPSVLFENLAKAMDGSSSFLIWTDLGAGVVRFHVSFQLDNGEIVQTPPSYTSIDPLTGNTKTFLNGLAISPCIAIAFSSATAPETGALAGRHVRALIVSIAVLDKNTVKLSQTELSQLDTLGTPGLGGYAESTTAQTVWEENFHKITFPPLRQNLRFYQRTIPVP